MHSMQLVVISMLLALELPHPAVAAGMSGWYVDAGHELGQTISQKALTPDDVVSIQREFIELFGLPKRVQNGQSLAVIRNSVPSFLIGIYKQLAEQSQNAHDEDDDDDISYTLGRRRWRRSANDSGDITGAHSRIITESDTIMTFLHDGNVHPLNERFNGTRLAFDFSEVSLDENVLLMAELHLHKANIFRNNADASPCIITVHADKYIDGQQSTIPIHTIDTTIGFEGWIRVNISEIAQYWITRPEPNHLLYVTIQSRDEHGGLVEAPVSAEALLSIWSKGRQPFVTAYAKNTHADGNSVRFVPHRYGKQRQRRSPSNRPPRGTSRQLNPLTDRDAHPTFQHCRRYGLYISFMELQLADVILAPTGYAAFYCSGDCKFPVPFSVRQSNHAIVQTLAHIRSPHAVPLPCCAPKRYAPISVIYVLKDTIFHLKKFPHMMVRECECQ